MKSPTRRDLLRVGCCTIGSLGLASSLSRLGMMNVMAQSAPDYRALVCVFLFGDELDEAQVKRQFPGVEFITPPLAALDESAAKTGWGECMDAAGISYEDLASGAAFLT